MDFLLPLLGSDPFDEQTLKSVLKKLESCIVERAKRSDIEEEFVHVCDLDLVLVGGVLCVGMRLMRRTGKATALVVL
eukprot:ANDGO_01233.mRNA.1 hypothetical protein